MFECPPTLEPDAVRRLLARLVTDAHEPGGAVCGRGG